MFHDTMHNFEGRRPPMFAWGSEYAPNEEEGRHGHGHGHGHHVHHGHHGGFGPGTFGPGRFGPPAGAEFGPGAFGPGAFGPGAFGPGGFGPGKGLGRMAWRMARGFPFGPGGFGRGFGPGGPGGFGPGGFGPGGPGGFGPGMPPRGGRMFGRGNLKYVLLDLLQERPKHGYEMIKELEERSSGFYTPSAGAIYPTLQLLEDRSWVTTQTSDGKRVYAITDAGREALKQHQQESAEYAGPRGWGERGERHGHGHGHGGPFGGGPFGREARPELDAIRRESMGVARLMRAAVLASGGDTQRLAQLRAIVERTRDDLNAFLGQPTSSSADQPNAQADAPTPTATNTDGPVEQL